MRDTITSRAGRWAIVVAVASAATVGGGAAPAHATASVEASRLQGADRYATAATIARSTFVTADRAVLASGETFADALAATFLAGDSGAPILLTRRDELPAATLSALDDLGVGEVVIAGGTGAVGEGVADALRADGFDVDRVAGNSRYDTAAALARRGGDVGLLGGARTAIVATGQGFADALAAGPVAYAGRFPLLLTEPAALHPAARSALVDLEIEHVLLLGGTGAVSVETEQAIAELDIDVDRVAGANRMETAARIADVAIGPLGFDADHVNIARGDAFADALAGAPHGGEEGSVILLTQSPTVLGDPTDAWLSGHEDTVAALHVFGGPGAVSDGTINAGRGAAGDSTVTGGPRFDSLSAREEIGYVNVIYDTSIVCSSVAGNGSDFIVHIGDGAVTVLEARCGNSGTTDTVVNLALNAAPDAGETVTVEARVGSDGNTVTDAQGRSQPSGDTVSGTANPL